MESAVTLTPPSAILSILFSAWPFFPGGPDYVKYTEGKSLAIIYNGVSHIRVGSHVVSVRIHCTEKWRTSFHTDVLRKSN